MTCNKEDMPPGTQWDENNYSCAYDALFTFFFVTYRLQNQKKTGIIYFKIPINIFLHYIMDSNNVPIAIIQCWLIVTAQVD